MQYRCFFSNSTVQYCLLYGAKNFAALHISPGAVESELQFGSSDAPSKQFLHEFYKQAIPAESIARAVLFAIEQPGDVDVNEIIVRPTQEEF